ncbi:MAG: glycosyl transferase, family 39 [Marmoricola sp.]|nr:glycosyl transferase, family 39 [Marmoricola sp.]
MSIPVRLERTQTAPGLARTASGDPVPSAWTRARLRAQDSDPVISWVGALAITALAGFLRLWDLGRPKTLLFDETYYAKDAWSLLHFGYAQNYVDKANDLIVGGKTTGIWTGTPEMVVHPEVGKWLIALGEATFGMNSFGWRIASAVAGTLMVLVMIRLARRVTRSTLLGLVAGVLMCFEGQQLVLSRLALLDIFLAFFLLGATSCLVADRDWGRARLAAAVGEGNRLSPSAWGPRLLWRPWRLAAGVWLGLALGTKWSALYPLAAFGLLMWAWDSGARRSFGVRRAAVKSAVLDALPAVGYVVVLPVLIYVVSWTGWLMHADVYERSLSDTQYGPYWGSYLKADTHGFLPELWRSLRSLWHYHHDVYSFHTGFLNKATHVYQSNPWGWFVLNRPVGVDSQLDIQPDAQGCAAAAGSTCLRQVLLLGNPVVWWCGTLALLWSVVAFVTRRDWRHGLVLVGVAATWLPWFQYDDRPIFSYYASMSLPFVLLSLVLALGEVLGRAGASRHRRTLGAAAAGTVVVATLLAFAWFWPIWTDQLVTNRQWVERMWFKRWI